MLYGMNMLLWSNDVTAESFLPLFERLKKMGFDGVEIPVFQTDNAKYAALAKHLDGLGLQRTAVTVRSAEQNPISPEAAVRRAGIEQMKQVLSCCETLGAKTLVGPTYAALGVFSGRGPTPEEWDHGVESMRAMANDAASHGVTLALEPLNRFEIYLLNTAADASRFARDVGHPNARVMYDTFHANIEEKSITKAWETCADSLIHVHISESDRGTPGTAQVNWRETGTALRRHYKGPWLTIEAFGTLLPELAAATRIWRRMYEDEEQLARDGLAFMKSLWNA